MDASWRRFALAALLLLALFFVALALLTQWNALGEHWDPAAVDWRARVPWLLAALALGTLNLAGMAALWTWLTRRLGEEVRYGEGITAWIASNLGRYIPGKVWQLAGLAAYMRARGRSGSVSR